MAQRLAAMWQQWRNPQVNYLSSRLTELGECGEGERDSRSHDSPLRVDASSVRLYEVSAHTFAAPTAGAKRSRADCARFCEGPRALTSEPYLAGPDAPSSEFEVGQPQHSGEGTAARSAMRQCGLA